MPQARPRPGPLALGAAALLLVAACSGGQGSTCGDDTSCCDGATCGLPGSTGESSGDAGSGGATTGEATTGGATTGEATTGAETTGEATAGETTGEPGPVGVRWDFEGEALGEATVDAPLREGGAAAGALRWIDGQRRGSVAARGRDGILRLDDAHAVDFAAADSFRVEATFRSARHGQGGEAGAGVIVRRGDDDGDGFALRVRDGHMVFSTWTGGQVSEVTSGARVSDDRWHQVSAVRDRDAGELVVVVDGYDVARAADASGDLSSDAPLRALGAGEGEGDAGRFWGALDLLAVAPGRVDAPPPTPEWDERPVFVAGVDHVGDTHYAGFRIPAIVRLGGGRLVAFAEGRVDDTCDFGEIHVVAKRSDDGGDTWSPLAIVAKSIDGAGKAGNPSPIADGDRVALMVLETPCEEGSGCACAGAQRFSIYRSDDGGESWTPREEITGDVTKEGWGGVLLGPGSGLRLERGPHAGTLVITAKHGGSAHLLTSDDRGESWTVAAEESTSPLGVNETTAAELSDGRILVNARYQRSLDQEEMEQELGFRHVGHVDTAWTYADDPTFARTSQFRGPVVHGALLYRAGGARHGDEARVLFAFPAGQHGTGAGRRHDLRVHVSRDDGAAWGRPRRMVGGWAAYSDLVELADGRVAALYEGGAPLGPTFQPYRALHLLRARPEWIDHASLVTYTFEELAAGDAVGGLAGAGGFALGLTPKGELEAVAGEHRSTALRFGDGAYACTGPTGGALDLGMRDSFAVDVTFRTSAHGAGGSQGAGALVAKTAVNTTPAWWLRVEDGRVRFLMTQCPGKRINCGLVSGACDLLNECTNAAITGGPDVSDGAWHHARVLRDAVDERLRLYVDGELVGEAAASLVGVVTNEEPLCLGAFAEGARPFTGEIDDVRIELP
ncbi:MAG: LamG-like jellyroll fold domain-containing protein [Nannocystaceae bacterium]